MRVMGVDYLPVAPSAGGQMWVTAHGRPLLEELSSLAWFDPVERRSRWSKLSGATGAVHRVELRGGERRGLSVVVKFCRFGQEVALGARSSFLEDVPAEVIDAARFNGPFEEFAAVEGLRSEARRLGLPRLHTKRPLAIYCPPQTFATWELGRSTGELHRCAAAMAAVPGDAVELHADRDYVLVYSWVRGTDAHALSERGRLGDDLVRTLTRQAADDMERCGYRCLDHKPRHVIVRPRRVAGDGLVARGGLPAYALVDFELLVHSPS